MSEPQVQPFKAEVSQVLSLVVNSLYSHKEIFLRELVSNASDALDKLRFRSVSEPELLSGDDELKIQIQPNEEANTLTISDNGIGMSEEELAKNLGTIAHSGTKDFLARLEKAKSEAADPKLIGQFGVGFYSGYLVADRIDVVSRAAGEETAHRWSSDAKDGFTIGAAERDSQGTTIILHLKEDAKEFLQGYRVRSLVQRYSDYIGHPIELLEYKEKEADPEKEGEEKAEKEPEKELDVQVINQASALWQRSPKDITDEQYAEFYKHLTHDWEPALSRRHFHIEGTQMFSGLLFLPKRPPFDMFDPQGSHGVRLHVKKVLIMEQCEELVPKHLRFIRGVIDSEDLPLNVSREILQDSSQVRVIRKQLTSQVLGMLEDLAKEKPEDYATFWGEFGAVLKEGLHFGEGDEKRLAKLLRYRSSTQDGLTSLADYVERMKDDQTAIYYATAANQQLLESSPHLEQLRARGYEILYMVDPIDSFAVEGIKEFEGKPLVSAMADDLKLGDADEDKKDEDKEKDEEKAKADEPLLERMKSVLSDKVSEVRASKRLADSPACLVLPDGGLAPHIERMFKARNMGVPETKRILEVNLDHPVVAGIKGGLDGDKASDWIWLLYDQALIAEGSPVEDPGSFAKRMTALMNQAVAS